MAGLLSNYHDTYTRVNPAEGLLQGFERGSRIGLAMRQQRMQEDEADRQNDMRQLQALFTAYGSLKSKTGKTQIGQAIFKVLGKYNPDIAGATFVHDESADKFMGKLRGTGKMLSENFDAGLQDINNLIQESAEEHDKGNLERQEYQDIVKGAQDIKTGAAEGRLAQLSELNRAAAGSMPYLKSSPEAAEERNRLTGEAERADFSLAQKYQQAQEESNLKRRAMAEKEERGAGPDFGDKELIKKTLTEIPKLKREAVAGANMSEQIDSALDLLNRGVTGKGGQIKSFLAPYAEALGYKGQALNDAQTYQLLTRAIIGPMRLEIVGPGPVSEWEQKLMQQISGGGGAAKQAATQLLTHWQKLADSRISSYNDTLEGLATVYPKVNAVYKPLVRKAKKTEAPSPANSDMDQFWKK